MAAWLDMTDMILIIMKPLPWRELWDICEKREYRSWFPPRALLQNMENLWLAVIWCAECGLANLLQFFQVLTTALDPGAIHKLPSLLGFFVLFNVLHLGSSAFFLTFFLLCCPLLCCTAPHTCCVDVPDRIKSRCLGADGPMLFVNVFACFRFAFFNTGLPGNQEFSPVSLLTSKGHGGGSVNNCDEAFLSCLGAASCLHQHFSLSFFPFLSALLRSWPTVLSPPSLHLPRLICYIKGSHYKLRRRPHPEPTCSCHHI